jgi:acetyl-CoA carboxylase carboxyltransferase component
MADYVVMVKKQATVYLGGPPLVKMAIGEIVDDETLGGAEMHSKVSGVSDFLAQNELHAIQLAREILQNLNYRKKTPLPSSHFLTVEEPLYDIEEILGIVGDNPRIPFDSREVIARIVDRSRISEFKPLYGPTLITCFARIHGIPVGILANNGVLFSECANKGTQFIQLCNQIDTPLLFLQNITGFMVGKKYEQEGIIKNGAKLINAISNSGVPAITVIIGASYGAGNYGMCGREYKPRFLFSWPNSKCSVMGPEQLSGVLDIVFRNAADRRGIKLDEDMLKMADARKQKLMKQIEEESSVYYTSSRMIDDGVIDPRDTRSIVGLCLSVIYTNEVKGGNIFGTSRM